MTPGSTGGRRGWWSEAWPDALAFGLGLGLAWGNEWATRDLVWSLWLSSLTVGYAMILWIVFSRTGRKPVALLGGVALLVFFTFHFGMFHLVHSVFLNLFFPVTDVPGDPGWEGFGEIFRSYWAFIPVALLAERTHFSRPAAGSGGLAEALSKKSDVMKAPYRGVFRMHLLIFFFFFASQLKLENFAVYAVVYAVYFFPWRLLRKKRAGLE